METFHGRTAVVTGGTRGIGRAITLALAQGGAEVLALYARDRKSAEALESEAKSRELRVRTIRGDLTDAESFDRVLGEIKSASSATDIIVHSAASGVHRSAMDLSDKHMRWTFDINFFRGSQVDYVFSGSDSKWWADHWPNVTGWSAHDSSLRGHRCQQRRSRISF